MKTEKELRLEQAEFLAKRKELNNMKRAFPLRAGTVVSHSVADCWDTWMIDAPERAVRLAKPELERKLGRQLEVGVDLDARMIRVVGRTMDSRAVPYVDTPRGDLIVGLGVSMEGEVGIDFAEHHHLLIGGLSGYGKTQCIKSIIVGLGDSVDKIVIDPSNSLSRLDRSIESILWDVMDIIDYRNSVGDFDRELFLFVDELPRVVINPQCNELLLSILREGRKAGVHVVAATQEVHYQTVSTSMRDGFANKVGFRMGSARKANMLGVSGAADLPRKGDGLLMLVGEAAPIRFVGYYHGIVPTKKIETPQQIVDVVPPTEKVAPPKRNECPTKKMDTSQPKEECVPAEYIYPDDIVLEPEAVVNMASPEALEAPVPSVEDEDIYCDECFGFALETDVCSCGSDGHERYQPEVGSW